MPKLKSNKIILYVIAFAILILGLGLVWLLSRNKTDELNHPVKISSGKAVDVNGLTKGAFAYREELTTLEASTVQIANISIYLSNASKLIVQEDNGLLLYSTAGIALVKVVDDTAVSIVVPTGLAAASKGIFAYSAEQGLLYILDGSVTAAGSAIAGGQQVKFDTGKPAAEPIDRALFHLPLWQALIQYMKGANQLPVILEDTTPPKLTLTKPGDVTKSAVNTIDISGETEPGATVMLNTQNAGADSSGKFAYSYRLSPGVNEISVKALDPAGNYTLQKLRIMFEEPTSIQAGDECSSARVDLQIVCMLNTERVAAGQTKLTYSNLVSNLISPLSSLPAGTEQSNRLQLILNENSIAAQKSFIANSYGKSTNAKQIFTSLKKDYSAELFGSYYDQIASYKHVDGVIFVLLDLSEVSPQ